MFEEIKQNYAKLEKDLMDPEIGSDPERLKEVSRKHSEIKDVYEMIIKLEKINEAIRQNDEIIASEQEGELKEMAKEEQKILQKDRDGLLSNINLELNPASPFDKKNIIMEIRAGTGGDESALFSADLFRMYSRYAEKKGWKVNILDSNRIGIGGFKEIIFSIQGKNVYSDLKFEAGTHRVQRVPETEKAGRIHTSAITVAVLPEAEKQDFEIKSEEIRIDTYAASGPGGQKVNTTNSAVRITHLPTGVIVQCQDQKSQGQNKEKAMQVLRSRLLAKAEEDRMKKEAQERKLQVGSGDRSEKIRTYNFPQDRVTDHRIKMSWHSILRILDGGLDEIIIELKKARQNFQ
jgi:peptide chain release factor 1